MPMIPQFQGGVPQVQDSGSAGGAIVQAHVPNVSVLIQTTWSGNSVSWYSSADAGYQYNGSGTTYRWVVIGQEVNHAHY